MTAQTRQQNLETRAQTGSLRPVLDKLKMMLSEDLRSLRSAADRRGAARLREEATIEVSIGGSSFERAPLIEYTHSGARAVLRNAKVGQSVSFVISSSHHTVSGESRIAWTSPLSNGRAVVGMELVRFNSVLEATV